MAKTVRMDQRRGGFKSRARKLMAVCMGGVLLLSCGQAAAEYLREGTLQRNLQGTPAAGTQNGPEFQGQVATCTLSEGSDGGRTAVDATGALTLSKDNLTVTLMCAGAKNQAVPLTLTKVCSATVQNPTVAECKTDTDGKQITLESLLGSNRSIAWKNTSQAAEEKQTNGEERALELQATDLPISDRRFFVGCDKNNDEKAPLSPSAECKVDVNVKARPSSVTDNNVVICAYGKDSNPEPLKVEMTTEKNTLTIQCGSEGSLNPETYATQYCDLQGEVGNCTLKTFEDIFSTYATSWWLKADDSRSATLTIPETDFPESEHQFRLGCVHKPANTEQPLPNEESSKTGSSQPVATTSNCNVIVIVRSGNSASSSAQMAAAIAGTAGLTGLLVGSL
ncbi:SRS domain-containing protein [Neospora caninum Liverpool]|uniref:SRS domain-containing protein n=1 Tax=Neospora caninum (strain Liverpool) TaxID=572307 RepID=F0VM87_NEOCL|nr:SRS domain-containing protein [Neospora caninum Liverpool]CBZ54365.1 SRS domain-containing protein [Neospora caninum Liverpool]CEL69071.1 TPA: SRS domain-containing protein [Neospora caninum Liverpool]|eukprot:XP_003884395.1 SRS domain-containing protein [Neospora caninum Liverpool]